MLHKALKTNEIDGETLYLTRIGDELWLSIKPANSKRNDHRIGA